jgi:mycoredoxin
MSWKTGFAQEITAAKFARSSGNEGKARVNARRAAGIVVAEYCRLHQILSPESAIKRLESIKDIPEIPLRALEITRHMLMPVDADHNLPETVDLISEAYELTRILGL